MRSRKALRLLVVCAVFFLAVGACGDGGGEGTVSTRTGGAGGSGGSSAKGGSSGSATAGAGGALGGKGMAGTSGGLGGSSGTGNGGTAGTSSLVDRDGSISGGGTTGSGGVVSADGSLGTGAEANNDVFVVSADGLTVTDATTKLTWQRDGSGTRAGCLGTTSLVCTYTQADAYCASLNIGGVSTWRVPTLKELQSLLDLSIPPPKAAINQKAFPDTPAEWFWTSTPAPNTGQSGGPWGVFFGDGFADYGGGVGSGIARVRCVRG